MLKEYCGGLCPWGEMHRDKPHVPIVNGDPDAEPVVGWVVDEDMEFDDEPCLQDSFLGQALIVVVGYTVLGFVGVRRLVNRCLRWVRRA